MDIKSKLSTLATPLESREAAATPGETLAILRRRMQELLEREPLVPPSGGVGVPLGPAPDSDCSDLPFVIEHTDRGVLWRRQETLAPSTHVGRIPLEAARDASSEMLALLALSPELVACRLDRALFLDLETTGLGGSGSLAFLVGLAWFDANGQLVIEQLLLRDPGDEPAMLEHLAERVTRSSLLVTYNGKTFDMPLLMTRYLMNRLPEPPRRPHLDLLHVARRLHKQRLGQCRLISLESGVLGFERREDDIPGGEIPPLYNHYLRTGDGGVLAPVVDHNAWDVMSMAALTGLYGEPLEALHCTDLVGLARTLHRAGALEQAVHVADRAVERGAGPSALFLRGQLAKARGDKGNALADFERLSQEVDDPRVRLELAKLYEHHVKAPLKALHLVELGTGEKPLQVQKRRERLALKAIKSKSKTSCS